MRHNGWMSNRLLALFVAVLGWFVLLPTDAKLQVSSPAAGTLTEIALAAFAPVPSSDWISVDRNGMELSRFKWEPHRYSPAPTEVFLEVFGTSSVPVRIEFFNRATNSPVAESATSFGTNGVLVLSRSRNIATHLPSTPTEISLMVRSAVNPDAQIMIRRAALLIQQPRAF
jgi:hypothetical protein